MKGQVAVKLLGSPYGTPAMANLFRSRELIAVGGFNCTRLIPLCTQSVASILLCKMYVCLVKGACPCSYVPAGENLLGRSFIMALRHVFCDTQVSDACEVVC